MLGVVRERRAGLMEEEREAALQAARDVRTRPLPRAPLRERANPRQIVAVRQLLDQQIGERRRGLADGEARMAAAFDERDALSPLEQRERRERSGEARADDGDVGVDACCTALVHGRRTSIARPWRIGAMRRSAVAREHALFEVHRVQAIAPRRDALRAVREPLEVPEIDEHPSTPSRVRQSQREAALDVVEAGRAERSGVGQRVDRAVARPRRHQRHDGRAAGEGGVDRAQQPASCSSAGMNGGEISRNTRSATPRSASASAACREVVPA